jgi:quinol monooxygenase YgiN
MFARHKVDDYKNWKRVYDDIGKVRKENGVTHAAVYRDTADPETIIVTHQFNSKDDATSFANSEDLKSAMQKAGVKGQPEFWFGENLESTPY